MASSSSAAASPLFPVPIIRIFFPSTFIPLFLPPAAAFLSIFYFPSVSLMVSDRHQSRQTQNRRQDGENRHNTGFRPAAQFKMMMQRSHTEKPPSSRQFEISHLKNDRNHLHQIDKTDDGNEKLHPHHISRSRHKAAQRKGTRIPHEHARGVYIKQKEP